MADLGSGQLKAQRATAILLNCVLAAIWSLLILACSVSTKADTMDDLDKVKQNLINKRWVQSADPSAEMRFRPLESGGQKAASRRGAARLMQMEFHSDGSCTIFGMDPADRPQARRCKWRLEMDHELRLLLDLGPDAKTRFIISDIKADRLWIKKK